MLHRPRNSGRECAWWTNSLVGQYLHQLSLLQSSRSIQRMQTVSWPRLSFSIFLGRTSLCLTDQETQEENVLGGPTPLWVSSYTSYLLYKVQDPFSACRQSHGQNFLFQIFREDQSSLHRPRNQKRMCLVDQLPCGSVLTPAISSTKLKIHSAHADSLMAKTFFFNFLERTSLRFTGQETKRECAWWTNSLVGQYLHQLSLAQRSRSILHMQAVAWPINFFLF